MFVGIDFDNTIIRYDELFWQVALDKKLISYEFPKDKNKIRNFLREKDLEEEWTTIQGIVYGRRISEACPFDHMFDTLLRLKQRNIPLCVVSHKTKVPYRGESTDLHEAAIKWLTSQAFFCRNVLGLSRDNVFFEITKKNKIDRIKSLGVTHFIDDLPDILEMLPEQMERILFNPNEDGVIYNEVINCKSWLEINKFLINETL